MGVTTAVRNEDAAARLEATVRHLAERIGPRPPGSAAEAASAEYLLSRFHELGIEARVESFVAASHTAVSSEVSVPGADGEFDSLPSQFSRAGRAEGPLVFVGTCDTPLERSDPPAGSVALLVPSGTHARRVSFLRELERRGVGAVVAVSPTLDAIQTKMLRYPGIRMPVAAVSFRTGCALGRRAGKRVRLEVACADGPIDGGESRNVVATLPGTGDAWLVVSSHCDTAPSAPGASDDASGTAVVLELARRMKDAKPPARVVFLLTGSEEYGENDGTARGALAFYRARLAELPSCIGHVDTDDLGKVLGVPRLSISGPRPFREAILADGLEARYLVRGRSGAGCDHGAAESHGVPYVWFNDTVSGNQPQLHTPDDTVEFLDFDRMAAFVGDIQAATERLAALGPVFPLIEADGTLIRTARSTDLPRMLDITRRAFAEVSMDRMRQEFAGGPLGGREWHEHKTAGVEAFYRAHPLWTIVAETAGVLSGYATYTVDPSKSLGAIGNNAVAPEFQGKGIGSRLQREVNRRIVEEGCATGEVTTLSNDAAAQRVYEKRGYERYAVSYHYLARLHGTHDGR